jgi:hypothetical protein
MAQHDYSLANQTGVNFRSDLNDALAAIVSQNSGLLEPTTKFAYQWWADTTSGLLKIRNAANSAWIAVGTLASANLGLLSLAGGTLTGALLLKIGSESLTTPALAFDGDPNTGVHRPAADQVSLVAGGTEFLRADLATYLQFLGTKAVLLPIGSTAQRPTGTNGLMRFNSDTGKFEGYAGGLWKDVGGAGGGAGFAWKAISGTAPDPSEEYGEIVNLFGAGLAQELYAAIKIPQGYTAGSQLFLYVSGYSPSASGTILLQAQSTLIRKATDAFDSTTNQRTTTNAALTNTVAKQLREFILDITDSSGNINSVAVSAGDIVKVRLYRGTDTDTADLRMIANATDMKLS